MEMNLKIPMGYKVYEEKLTIDVNDVEKIFENKGGDYVSLIEKTNDNKAVITRHKVKCPHCNKTSGLYFRKLYAEVYDDKEVRKVRIQHWLDNFGTVFMGYDTSFFIDELRNFSGDFTCSECGFLSEKSDEFCEINLIVRESGFVLKRELRHLKDITDIKWTKENLLVSFPMYEQVVFDFESGLVNLGLISGDSVISKTVTNQNVDLSDDFLIATINKNRILKRLLKRIIEKITTHKILIDANELDFQKFVNITYFNGFPEEFYDAIPFKEGTTELDSSFVDLAKELRNPETAMELLKKSTIPDCKSIRKVFTSKSGLFFYIKECEMLYDFFKDVNVLTKVLKKDYIYSFLVDAHYYNLKPFFDDFATVCDKKTVIWLSDKLTSIKTYAVNYNSLSEYGKKAEQEKWLKKDKEFYYIIRGLLESNLSIPMHSVPENAINTTLGKYTFKWLRTKNDYTRAGKALGNCLTSWWSSSNPVAVVMMNEKIIAALEVAGNEVIQARKEHNDSIDENSELYKTISKWCEMQQIIIQLDNPDYYGMAAPF